MTASRPAAGAPSNSGVRRGGDGFQDLFVWGAAMRVIGPDSRFNQVEVEITGAGNVDDVVLRSRTAGGDSYGQVKWATNPADLVDDDYLTTPPRGGKSKSLLQKLYNSHVTLGQHGDGHTMQLITNRALDGSHPLLGHVDGRTDLLLPYASQAAETSKAGKAVDHWAEHVGSTREELLDMLGHLQFITGRTISAEREHVRTLMLAAGLDGSDSALQHGLTTVTGWVVGGTRVISEQDIHQAVAGLRREAPSALLVVQAIDIDPHADEATVALNWVDMYDGTEPRARVIPRDTDSWNAMDRELAAAAATLENEGWTSTVVRGSMRQATFFRVGTALPQVRQHTLRYLQRGEIWSTGAAKVTLGQPTLRRTPIKLGQELAVAVGTTIDPTDEVVNWLQTNRVPIDHLLTVTPAAGPDDASIESARHAVTYAEKVRNLVRAELGDQPFAEAVHLYLAGPGGLALLLGHRWNRTRTTVVYEHLGAGLGYTPAFTIPG
ncbi:SAVED domain-containing protein [Amycolatopsis sp. EV170708-02-1]|uniref:SAVED domain-containing protein n=1 Tax=Amycolatopsis sp. EV170708-02-1 TaxID=2919322 RepID=UPI001F0BE152|nr:SAVED domain-containing protein [Amycolatopsis sp. EV170708-02-1]UMP01271.1 SAVED domain-containing protein [Amycolatopsis sp. EV170708-02-1]